MANQTTSTETQAREQKAELDRRRGERIRCNHKARWRISGTRSAGSGKATLHDISRDGISLVVHSLPKCGTILDVSVERGPDQSYFLPQPVRVRHVKAQPNGTWLLGCRFTKRLGKEEFESLLLEQKVDVRQTGR
jgi:c-di-GMP-binding flagellar brake protein YcgR